MDTGLAVVITGSLATILVAILKFVPRRDSAANSKIYNDRYVSKDTCKLMHAGLDSSMKEIKVEVKESRQVMKELGEHIVEIKTILSNMSGS